MTRLTTLALLVGMSACAPAFAQAVDTCHGATKHPHEEAVEALSGEYGEAVVGVMLEVPQNETHAADVITLWANEETGTWSLTLTDTNMMTCLISYGEDIELIQFMEVPQGTMN